MCTVEAMKRTRWILSELREARLASEVEVIEPTGRALDSYIGSKSTHHGGVSYMLSKIAARVQKPLRSKDCSSKG